MALMPTVSALPSFNSGQLPLRRDVDLQQERQQLQMWGDQLQGQQQELLNWQIFQQQRDRLQRQQVQQQLLLQQLLAQQKQQQGQFRPQQILHDDVSPRVGVVGSQQTPVQTVSLPHPPPGLDQTAYHTGPLSAIYAAYGVGDDSNGVNSWAARFDGCGNETAAKFGLHPLMSVVGSSSGEFSVVVFFGNFRGLLPYILFWLFEPVGLRQL